MSMKAPANHPKVNWDDWEAPGEGDVRSPCPMLNILANHHILPHSGKHITRDMAVEALTTSINLSPTIASVFAFTAVRCNPSRLAHTFDLDQVNVHGIIEHDCSLSRGDYSFGDNHRFNLEIWEKVLASYGDEETTSFSLATKARYARVMAAKESHEEAGLEFTYGAKEWLLSYGETALMLGILGNPYDGQVPIKYLRTFFEEERMPVKEGWKRNEHVLTQTKMNHILYNLLASNEHSFTELKNVGVGTAVSLYNKVWRLMGSQCSVM